MRIKHYRNLFLVLLVIISPGIGFSENNVNHFSNSIFNLGNASLLAIESIPSLNYAYILIIFFQFLIILFFLRNYKLRKSSQISIVKKSFEYDRFFNLESDLICIFDLKGRITKINNACKNILGIESHEIINMDLMSFFDDKDASAFSTAIEQSKDKNEILTIEVKLSNASDDCQYIEWKISRYGKQFYGIARDITERRENSDRRVKIEKQILQTQKLESLGVLAGGIAHDFNNILMAVLGHSELARMEISTTSPAYSNLKEIESASKKASRLCSQMLAYTGRASYTLEKVNINKLIDEMIHLVKTLISKKAVLNISLKENLSYINADPSQISQVIMNLIINSSDAIGDRNGVISISTGSSDFDREYLSKTDLSEQLEPGKYVFFEISDSGCGMSSENIARIFEPFYTTKFTGRGLGLAAVHGIIRSHKGSIKVYSEEGKGSNFKVMFPADKNNSSANIENTQIENNNWKGSGTILFVDDENTLRFLGSDMLKKLGFEVLTAVDGVEAVNIYKKRKNDIDLVILDLTMPNMDGSQAFSEIRNINEEVKVIIASGYSLNDINARFSGKSLAGVIQKPYSMEKMREILEKI